jgi:hypothetical protein
MLKAGRTFSFNAVAACAALALMVVLGGGYAIQAQYLISTRAGFVNRVEGRVYIERQESESGERGRASLGTQMKEGDRLITDHESKAEILLNPGAYLRLGSETEIRAITTVYDETRFEIVKGSVMVEVGELMKNTVIELQTPSGLISIGKTGLQRINVSGDATIIEVRQGEIGLGSRDRLLAKRAPKIKSGRMIRLEGQNTETIATIPEAAKISKDAPVDDLDYWSFTRGQALMAANGRVLQRTSLRSAMGLGWYYDPFFNCYTFIPGGGGFYSPYGFPFFRRFADFQWAFPWGIPYNLYNPYWNYNDGRGGSSGGGGVGVGNPPTRVIAGTERTGIRREIESRGLVVGGNDGFSRMGGTVRGGASPGFSTAAPVSTGTVTSAPSASAAGSSGGGTVSVGGRPGRP